MLLRKEELGEMPPAAAESGNGLRLALGDAASKANPSEIIGATTIITIQRVASGSILAARIIIVSSSTHHSLFVMRSIERTAKIVNLGLKKV